MLSEVSGNVQTTCQLPSPLNSATFCRDSANSVHINCINIFLSRTYIYIYLINKILIEHFERSDMTIDGNIASLPLL